MTTVVVRLDVIGATRIASLAQRLKKTNEDIVGLALAHLEEWLEENGVSFSPWQLEKAGFQIRLGPSDFSRLIALTESFELGPDATLAFALECFENWINDQATAPQLVFPGSAASAKQHQHFATQMEELGQRVSELAEGANA